MKNNSKASKNSHDTSKETKYCPCCINRLYCLDSPVFPLSTPIKELKELGVGFPLYFYFKTIMILVLAVLVALVGIPCTIINLTQQQGHKWVGQDEFSNNFSIGSHGRNSKNYRVTGWIIGIVLLNALGMFCMASMFVLYSSWKSAQSKKLVDKLISPSYFTVMVDGISKKTRPSEIQEWLEEKHDAKEIREITYCFDVHDIIMLVQKIKEARNDKSYLEAYSKRIKFLFSELDHKSNHDQDEKSYEEESKVSNGAPQKSNTSQTDNSEDDFLYHPPSKTKFCCIKEEWPTLKETNQKLEDLQSELMPVENQERK